MSSSLHDLDDHLAGVDVLDDLGADGALLDALHEVLDDLVVDVGFEQGHAHLAHGHVDIVLGDPAAAGEAAEGSLEAIGEGVEHAVSLAASGVGGLRQRSLDGSRGFGRCRETWRTRAHEARR